MANDAQERKQEGMMECAYYGVRPGTLATAHPRKLGGLRELPCIFHVCATRINARRIHKKSARMRSTSIGVTPSAVEKTVSATSCEVA